jgi:hypothetical protein
MSLVLDCSAGLAWLLPDEGAEPAPAVLDVSRQAGLGPIHNLQVS